MTIGIKSREANAKRVSQHLKSAKILDHLMLIANSEVDEELAQANLLLGVGEIVMQPTDQRGIVSQESLHLAAELNKPHMIHLLLDRLPAGSVSYLFDQDTALHRAAQSGANKSIDALLKAGADIHARGKDKTTVLHAAVQSEQKGSLSRLVKAGARWDLKNKYGEFPLWLAFFKYIEDASANNLKLWSECIKLGADIKGLNSKGESLAHYLIRYYDGDVDRLEKGLDLLKKEGFPFTIRNKEGQTLIATLLGSSIWYGSDQEEEAEKLLKRLLLEGVDPRVADKKGIAPADLKPPYHLWGGELITAWTERKQMEELCAHSLETAQPTALRL